MNTTESHLYVDPKKTKTKTKNPKPKLADTENRLGKGLEKNV